MRGSMPCMGRRIAGGAGARTLSLGGRKFSFKAIFFALRRVLGGRGFASLDVSGFFTQQQEVVLASVNSLQEYSFGMFVA